MVSGGIAPGVNAVIDGIVQRHWQYAKGRRGELSIYGLTDGFLSLGNWKDAQPATESREEATQARRLE